VVDRDPGDCLTVAVTDLDSGRDTAPRLGLPESWLDLGRLAIAELVARRRRDRGGAADEVTTVDPELLTALRRAAVADAGGSSIAAWIAQYAALTASEVEVLAVLLAVEVDPALHRLVAYANGEATRGRLTVGNLVELLDEPTGEPVDGAGAAFRSMAPGSALRRAALVELVEDGPLVERVVAVPPALVWAVAGLHEPDPDLPDGAEHLDLWSPESELPAPLGGAPFVVVTGPDRRLRWLEAARLGLTGRVLVVPAPVEDRAWAAVVREATLTGRSVVVEVDDELPAAGRRWIDRADHLGWIVSSLRDVPVSSMPVRPWVECLAPEREPTDDEWSAAFEEPVERTHRLTHEQLHTVSRVLPAVGGDLDAAVRRLVGGRLDRMAQRIRPTRVWDDLVVSPDRAELLRSIVDRYRYADRVYDEWGFSATPSRGVVAVFAGPSGTGKTLATEIIAGVLGLDVFKLDLSAVVSKYIGETEKNLEQIFDAASAGNLVLFFDEADSLFGKRSEVKDARDRYANIEVSYLLQRLERYDGMVILATNFEKNIDEAFVRRIHVRIEFAMPGVAERRRIWAQNLPPTAPVQDVDLDWLATRFELSGGSIRNASVHAAFLAAAEGTPITMEHAVRGVAREWRKIGRLIKPNEFGEYHDRLGLVPGGEPV
jgi:AAA+ superfamily predicted ATPase